MAHIRLVMPRGGEEGVIVANYYEGHLHYRVEFRGKPYSQWDIGDDTPMIRLHSALETVNISDFQNGYEQTMTHWNKEYPVVLEMIADAIWDRRK